MGMEEWKEYKLGELLSIRYGKDHKKLNDGIIPVYGSGGIMRYVNQSIYDSPSILIPRKGSLNNIIYTETPFWTVDTMFWTIVNTKLVDPKYLYYAICKFDFAGLNVGSAVPSLTVPVIGNIDIILPSLNKQKNIVNILSILDNKIELNRRINENLEQQAQALFKSWFVDFEPFKDGKFVDSELGMIPEGWKVGQLLDFGKIICGKTPSKSIKEFFGGDIPFIKIPDMHNQLFIINTEDSLSVEGNQTQQTKLLPPYSLLVSCIATVGLIAINTRPSHTNQQINSIVPQNKNSLYYLYLNLTLMKKQLENMGRGGTATLNINTTSFGKIRMIIPNNEVLVKFSHTVEPLFKEIEILSKQTFELTQLRNTLLPKLMSGELKINDFNN